MQRVIIAIFISLISSTAIAQTLQEKLQRGTVMNAEAFKALTDGNTITYNNGTDDVYREYYRPGSNRIIIEWTEARDPSQLVCDLGRWYEENGLICFDWEASGAVCALWVDYQGEYISAVEGPEGQMDHNIEVISTITDTPLFCEVGMVELMADIPNSPAG